MESTFNSVMACVAAYVASEFIVNSFPQRFNKAPLSYVIHGVAVALIGHLFLGAWMTWVLPLGLFLIGGTGRYASEAAEGATAWLIGHG